MAEEPSSRTRPRLGFLLLARQLKFGCGDGERAASVLRRAARRYPADFRIHFELAHALGPPLDVAPYADDLFTDPEEAVRHLSTAVAIRPGSVSTHLVLAAAFAGPEETRGVGGGSPRSCPDQAQ